MARYKSIDPKLRRDVVAVIRCLQGKINPATGRSYLLKEIGPAIGSFAKMAERLVAREGACSPETYAKLMRFALTAGCTPEELRFREPRLAALPTERADLTPTPTPPAPALPAVPVAEPVAEAEESDAVRAARLHEEVLADLFRVAARLDEVVALARGRVRAAYRQEQEELLLLISSWE